METRASFRQRGSPAQGCPGLLVPASCPSQLRHRDLGGTFCIPQGSVLLASGRNTRCQDFSHELRAAGVKNSKSKSRTIKIPPNKTEMFLEGVVHSIFWCSHSALPEDATWGSLGEEPEQQAEILADSLPQAGRTPSNGSPKRRERQNIGKNTYFGVFLCPPPRELHRAPSPGTQRVAACQRPGGDGAGGMSQGYFSPSTQASILQMTHFLHLLPITLQLVQTNCDKVPLENTWQRQLPKQKRGSREAEGAHPPCGQASRLSIPLLPGRERCPEGCGDSRASRSQPAPALCCASAPHVPRSAAAASPAVAVQPPAAPLAAVLEQLPVGHRRER